MPSQYDDQFKVHIPKEIQNVFRRAVSRKWGIDKYGLLSHEIKQLMLYYDSVDGRIPSTAHTQKNRNKSSTKDIRTESYSDNVTVAEMENETGNTTAIVTKTAGEGGDYSQRDPREDPRLKQWFLEELGIDLGNPDNIASHLTPEDYRVGDLSTPNYNQWKKEMHTKVDMKIKRIHSNERLTKLHKRDEKLESEMIKIKQHIVDTESIKGNKIHEDQIYKAWAAVTEMTDRQRTFRNRLHVYTDAGYFSPLDGEHKKYRAEEKFLVL